MITEKDFIEAITKAATFARNKHTGQGGVRYHQNEMKEVFELAKKMAVEFDTWKIKEGYLFHPSAGKYKSIYANKYNQLFSNEQLLELYLNQKL